MQDFNLKSAFYTKLCPLKLPISSWGIPLIQAYLLQRSLSLATPPRLCAHAHCCWRESQILYIDNKECQKNDTVMT